MRKSLFIYACIAMLGFGVYSCKPNDEKLQKEVETALVATPGLTTAVKNGEATISGVVETEEAKQAIEQAAKAVKGIKSVVNNIEVKPVVQINTDDVLKASINAALTAGGFSTVVATIENGIVTLTGDIKRADLEKVMQIANEAKPERVENKLTLK
jgi:osmotically-inducible protein OsmY